MQTQIYIFPVTSSGEGTSLHPQPLTKEQFDKIFGNKTKRTKISLEEKKLKNLLQRLNKI